MPTETYFGEAQYLFSIMFRIGKLKGRYAHLSVNHR